MLIGAVGLPVALCIGLQVDLRHLDLGAENIVGAHDKRAKDNALGLLQGHHAATPARRAALARTESTWSRFAPTSADD